MKKTLLLTLLLVIGMLGIAKGKAIDLNVVHINDHHSHLEAETMELLLDGKKTKLTVGGFARVNQAINEITKNNKNSLVVHAGDAISGTLYYTLFNGKADAAVMNVGRFDVFTLGNHEFDNGNTGLKTFLDELKVPVISSNVIAEKGSILEGKWTPYIIKKISGEDIALVGLDVVGKTVQSSSPGKDIKFVDEVEAAEKIVKELQNKGINKIIFVSHAGYEKNLEIAKKVSGIDIIITGDTHYLLGENFKKFGLNPVGEYPTKVTSPTGEPVYIAEAWNYSYAVGNLKVKFDKNGVITQIVGEPSILIGIDKFTRKGEDGKEYTVEGTERESILKFIKENKELRITTEDARTKTILSRYTKEKEELGKKPVGKIVDTMPGGSANRIPNEKNPEGSVATTMVSQTVLEKLKKSGTGKIDLVILNSGGVRADITQGDMTYDQVYTLLPFTSNTIYTLEMTGEEIKAVLEDALNFVFGGGSSGAFPYGAGIRYEAKKAGTLGNRVTKIEVLNAKTNKWEPINRQKTYTVGTNSYIASGKDGYTTFEKVTSKKPGVNTYLGVETAFIEYLQENKEMKRPQSSNVKFTY